MTNKINEFIKRNNLEITAIAKLMHIDEIEFRNILEGISVLYVDDFEKLCKAMSVSPHIIFKARTKSDSH